METPDRRQPPPVPGENSTASRNLRARLSALLIKALAVYSAIVVLLTVGLVLIGSHDSRTRAEMMMAAGLILLWVVAGGLAMLKYRETVRKWVLSSGLHWQLKFILLATLLALLEEGITTSMTNLAPEFGSKMGIAYITASNNYLIVIGFSSVVVFVPEFVGWSFLLKRYDFSPNEVFLIYGLLGTTMEGTINITSLIGGFWFFVYGLMVYLPAYSLPRERQVVKPSWLQYAMGYFVPLLFAIPVVVADTLAARWLGIHLWA